MGIEFLDRFYVRLSHQHFVEPEPKLEFGQEEAVNLSQAIEEFEKPERS